VGPKLTEAILFVATERQRQRERRRDTDTETDSGGASDQALMVQAMKVTRKG